MTDKLLEAANRLAHQLSIAAFNAGVEDAGDAWTRQEKTAIKQNQTLASLLNAISALAAQAEQSAPAYVSAPKLGPNSSQHPIDYSAAELAVAMGWRKAITDLLQTMICSSVQPVAWMRPVRSIINLTDPPVYGPVRYVACDKDDKAAFPVYASAPTPAQGE